MTVIILIASFIVLMLLGVPVVWAMLASNIAALIFGDLGMPMSWLFQQTFHGANMPELAAIPLFLFAGELMNRGGLTQHIIRVAEFLLGRITGGLGLVNVLTAFVYGGITGSATADTSTVAKIMVPSMEERGYTRSFSAAVTAASGTLGIIVPPSVIMILYGVLTNTSIGGMFMAGVIPGLMLALIFMLTAYLIGKKNGFPKLNTLPSKRQILHDLLYALPAILMPVLILVSLVSGFATATEAAAISVVYALLVGMFIYRRLSIKDLWPSINESVRMTGSVMMIMAVAMPFGWILTFEQVPYTVAHWIMDIGAGHFVSMFLIIGVLVIVGFWLDLGPAMIILAPILVPVAKTAGFEPYQIGVIFTMTLGLGLFTPPVGTNLFVVCNVARIDIGSVAKSLIPFWIATVCAIALLVFIPDLTQWLPRLLGY